MEPSFSARFHGRFFVKHRQQRARSGTRFVRYTTKEMVYNASRCKLSSTQTSVLAKGLNFAVVPHTDKLPTDDFIVATAQLPGKDKNKLRNEVAGLLCSFNPPLSNIAKEERKALEDLKKVSSITILPANKGKCTVVMDKEEYEKKIKCMLDDKNTYQTLNQDPTQSYKKKLIQTLQSLKKEYKNHKRVNTSIFIPHKKLLLGCTARPQFYKQNLPLRPIVLYWLDTIQPFQIFGRPTSPISGTNRASCERHQGSCR